MDKTKIQLIVAICFAIAYAFAVLFGYSRIVLREEEKGSREIERIIIPAPQGSGDDMRQILLDGNVSFYSEDGCLGCRSDLVMKCGGRFNENDFTIAVRPDDRGEPTIPCGTFLHVVHGKKSVTVRVADTGGFAKYGRIGDLSKAAFAKIADLDRGIVRATIKMR